MSTELQDALSRAANDARASFETRDALDVIAPATKRVRRHRARVTSVVALGSVAVLAGALWAADAAGGRYAAPVGPAAPTTQAPDVQAPADAWSTQSLADIAEPRLRGETRTDAVAGMACRHAVPTDDPRLSVLAEADPTISSAYSINDCDPVWFVGGPSTETSEGVVRSTAMPSSLNVQASLTNTSDHTLVFDTDSVFMWVESEPATPNDDSPAMYPEAIVGTSMWTSSGTTIALLNSSSDNVAVAPGDSFDAQASANADDDSLLSQLIESKQPMMVSLWARIHEDNPTGDMTYLIQLGGAVGAQHAAS